MDCIAVTGATGYVGGRLVQRLHDDGRDVRCLVRNPDRAELPDDVGVVKGDVVEGDGLDELLDGVGTAYYLVHSMGGGSGSADEFADLDRRGAETFARAAARAGVRRIVYLGGLDSDTTSEHLSSRHEVAHVLDAESGDAEVAYARAAMVIGEGSASFQMLTHLVRKLPLMITPRWVDTRSQPIAIRDVIAALIDLGLRDDHVAEAQLGGADVLTYREMMRRAATVFGRRPPAVVPTPVLTPRLSSYWVSLFTPYEPGLVRPLVDGLSAEMIVTEPPPPGVNDDPLGFEAAVRAASGEPAVA